MSKGIKTRNVTKDVKALDKAATVAERMKDAFVRTKDGTAQAQQDGREHASPAGYAENKITEKADNTVHGTAHQVKKQGGKAVRKIKNARHRRGRETGG